MEAWIIFIIAFLFFDLILVVFIFWRKKRGRKFLPEEANYIRSHWVRVIDSFHANPAQAVMDADKILDYALGRKGFQGSLGEKLKKAGGRFSDENGIWFAHKLRNTLAHELGKTDEKDLRQALGQFKKALNDLGANL